MTEKHPITPPPELVQQLWSQCTAKAENPLNKFATLIARWGGDQELEACIKYFHEYDASWGEHSDLVTGLRATRRPKPLSQADLALEALDAEDDAWPIRSLEKGQRFDTIRAALKRLKELEQANSQPS